MELNLITIIIMNKRYTGLVILNTITFLIVLFVNYAASTHLLADDSVGDVSHKYDTLFAPADYAFLIWPVIYLLCICFVIYEWVLLKNDAKQYIKRTGIWFAVSNIANALWCYCWVHEWLGWSVIIILIQLISLTILVVHLRLELDDEPVRTYIFYLVANLFLYRLDNYCNRCLHCIVAWCILIGMALEFLLMFGR